MSELNNLELLTDQIYREGVEKAEVKSREIIEDAEKQKLALLSEAREEADKILSNAKKESDRIQRSMLNELNLKGNQFMSDLKVEIGDMLSEKIIDTNIGEAFANADFFKDLIIQSVDHWKKTDELEVVLPQSIEDKMRKAFNGSILRNIPNLTVTFKGKLENGFRIGKKGDSYQVSFGEEDFKKLFQTYLTDQVNEILFRNE